MAKLFLFDIDGTLITGTQMSHFTQTLQDLHGLNVPFDKDYRGYTDYLIFAALLKDEGWSDEQIKQAMPQLLTQMDAIHKRTFTAGEVQLLPGVTELLEALSKDGNTLGLITGNLETIAERKLTSLGIWKYFTLGGFGSDPHETRGDLVKLAIRRAGFKDKVDQVYVFGDTPRDIAATHEAGVENSVGVANGFRPISELVDAGARFVFEDFHDTNAVLKTLLG